MGSTKSGFIEQETAGEIEICRLIEPERERAETMRREIGEQREREKES